MNRMFRAGLVALPLLLAAGQSASANDKPGMAGTRWGCNQHGCGGFCLQLFPHINMHGPLVNYGPYSGYYPFAPYGPWDANLQYHGGGDCGGWGCGKHGCGTCGRTGLLGHLGHGNGLGWGKGSCGHSHHTSGCDSCGWKAYAGHTYKNVCHRINPFHGHKPACSTCAP